MRVEPNVTNRQADYRHWHPPGAARYGIGAVKAMTVATEALEKSGLD
jgi:hypothetical protein